MDLKAAPSDTLERTLVLAWAGPAHCTQSRLRGSHTESLELFWLFGNASRATPMLCQTKRTFTHNKKTCLSMPLLPRPLDHATTHMFAHLSNHEPSQSAATVSSLSCHLHAHTCLLRKPCLRAQFFTRSSVRSKPSPLYIRPTNDASPSKRRRRDRHNNRW